MSKEQKALKSLKILKNLVLSSEIMETFRKAFNNIEQALEDLELYKKAFEIATKNNKYEMLVIKRQARKELNDSNKK